MLCLDSETDAAWVACAMQNLDALLVDHAHCEHKAAITALSFISKYPDDPVLVEKLAHLACEESEHLARVSKICHKRGLSLGHPGKDPYVQTLLSLARSGSVERRVDRLLICALIEARSCERLKLIALNVQDEELKAVYDESWKCEAGHHTLFIELAERSLVIHQHKDPKGAVKERLKELAAHEANFLKSHPIRPAIH